jgi:hypothetical protein
MPQYLLSIVSINAFGTLEARRLKQASVLFQVYLLLYIDSTRRQSLTLL